MNILGTRLCLDKGLLYHIGFFGLLFLIPFSQINIDKLKEQKSVTILCLILIPFIIGTVLTSYLHKSNIEGNNIVYFESKYNKTVYINGSVVQEWDKSAYCLEKGYSDIMSYGCSYEYIDDNTRIVTCGC